MTCSCNINSIIPIQDVLGVLLFFPPLSSQDDVPTKRLNNSIFQLDILKNGTTLPDRVAIYNFTDLFFIISTWRAFILVETNATDSRIIFKFFFKGHS